MFPSVFLSSLKTTTLTAFTYVQLTKIVIFIEIIIAVVGERAKRARHYQGCTNSS